MPVQKGQPYHTGENTVTHIQAHMKHNELLYSKTESAMKGMTKMRSTD